MTLILCPRMSLSFCFPNCVLPLNHNNDFGNTLKNKPHTNPVKLTPSKFCPFTNKFSNLGAPHVAFCSRNGKFDDFSGNKLSQPEHETLELLSKPLPVPVRNGSLEKVSTQEEEALEPFLKFFKGSDSPDVKLDGGVLEVSEERDDDTSGNGENEEEEEEAKKVNGVYYEPKPGDLVVGVVVAGNENRLSVNVGAELTGTMLTKEVLPLSRKEMKYLLCDGNKDGEENFMVQGGRMGILRNEYDATKNGVMVPGSSVLEIGTVLFAEVLGRTLTGRPLLSSRRLFRRIAWHRLRIQAWIIRYWYSNHFKMSMLPRLARLLPYLEKIKQLKEPIKVRITEWNTKGLLTRIEGLRAFLPKAELMKRVNSFAELKENVGRSIYVQITEVEEAKNNVILSEKEAWEKLYLREGTLLEGTVKTIHPYGAQIRIGETNRSGLLHVSNITRAEITSVSDILSVDEKVKVLVVKSAFPDKISLSIADLESEPGLFLSNKERVFVEADMMAKKYKEKLPIPAFITQRPEPLSNSALLPFENEEAHYANWKWFKFEK